MIRLTAIRKAGLQARSRLGQQQPLARSYVTPPRSEGAHGPRVNWRQYVYPKNRDKEPRAVLRHAHLTPKGGALPFGLSCALGVSGGLAYWSSCTAEEPRSGGSAGDGSRVLTRNFIADAVEEASPSVVNISFQKGNVNQFFISEASGSGVIISEDGNIVTNAHVVGGAGDNELKVTLSDGEVLSAHTLALDAGSDLAVIRLHNPTNRRFPAAKLGKSGQLRAGEWVVALGSPLRLKNSVTAGIVSTGSRDMAELGLRSTVGMFIQHDAAVNQGNSGGPLVNLDGEVVGINSMVAADGQGISFAIPIDTARGIMQQLKEKGRVTRPYLGMSIVGLSPELLRSPRLRREFPTFPHGVEQGVFVGHIAPASPAQRAGLQPGDVIIEFDGKPVKSTAELLAKVAMEVERAFTMTVARGSSRVQLKITTASRR